MLMELVKENKVRSHMVVLIHNDFVCVVLVREHKVRNHMVFFVCALCVILVVYIQAQLVDTLQVKDRHNSNLLLDEDGHINTQ